MSYSFLVIQHSDTYQPGRLLTQAARDNRINLSPINITKQSVTDFDSFDALIILGAPFELDQKNIPTALQEEKRLLRVWMNLNRPFLGFNLGQHLLAEASGAQLGPGYTQSRGFIQGHLTHEGKKHPLFQGLPNPLSLLKWHDLAISSPLPRKMVLLATSKDCMVEACCLEGRPHVIGLQCDNYAATPEDTEALILTHQKKRSPSRPGTEDPLIKTARTQAAESVATFHQLIHNFATML